MFKKIKLALKLFDKLFIYYIFLDLCFLDMITISPRPLSPESEAFVDKIELVRTPKLSDNGN